jgi:hypothetical protein
VRLLLFRVVVLLLRIASPCNRHHVHPLIQLSSSVPA